MGFQKLKTKRDYEQTLERFEEIFQAKTGTKESDEADVLSLLIKDYEDRHFEMQMREECFP